MESVAQFLKSFYIRKSKRSRFMRGGSSGIGQIACVMGQPCFCYNDEEDGGKEEDVCKDAGEEEKGEPRG